MITLAQHDGAFAAMAASIGVSAAMARDALQGWNVRAVLMDGEPVGGIAVKGAEIHCGLTEKAMGRWFSRRIYRETITDVFRNNGYVTTSVRNENAKGHDFVTRLGFVQTGKDDRVTFYEIRP